jgi:GntR family transcriptional repressor for pyruvate dehydrogenase complex
MPVTLEEFNLVDRQFHSSVASACGNPVLVEVYGRVLETLVQAELSPELILGIDEDTDPAAAITQSAVEHRAIAEAFASRDMPAMFEAMEAHLGAVEGRMSLMGALSRHQQTLTSPASERTLGL